MLKWALQCAGFLTRTGHFQYRTTYASILSRYEFSDTGKLPETSRRSFVHQYNISHGIPSPCLKFYPHICDSSRYSACHLPGACLDAPIKCSQLIQYPSSANRVRKTEKSPATKLVSRCQWFLSVIRWHVWNSSRIDDSFHLSYQGGNLAQSSPHNLLETTLCHAFEYTAPHGPLARIKVNCIPTSSCCIIVLIVSEAAPLSDTNGLWTL